MAKKSAKSKGYRKQNVKKPYLSKREVALLCALAAVLVVAAFFLFRYDDGALKIQDGAVVAEGDNWLIVNGSNVRGRARYFKLGEMGEIDGYAREAGALATDANIPEYTFNSESDGAAITVSCNHSSAATLAEYAAATLADLENTDVGEVQTGEFAGRPVSYFIYDTQYDASDDAEAEAETDGGDEAEEAAPDRFSRVLSGYIDASHDSCVSIHIESDAESAEDRLADEDLTALLERAVSAVALESAE